MPFHNRPTTFWHRLESASVLKIEVILCEICSLRDRAIYQGKLISNTSAQRVSGTWSVSLVNAAMVAMKGATPPTNDGHSVGSIERERCR